MKRYKKHDYKDEILKLVREERGQSKDAICRKIGGSRNDVYQQIDVLIKEEILRYEKKGLFLNPEGDVWNGPLKELEGTISMDKEIIFKTRIPRIEKTLKKSKKPIFYHEPVIIKGQKFEGNLHRINDDAKNDLLGITWNIDRLIRSQFTLFATAMLNPPPNEYKPKIDKAQKDGLKLITEIRKKLASLTPKEYMEVFDEWWFQITAGLKLTFKDAKKFVKKLDLEKLKKGI